MLSLNYQVHVAARTIEAIIIYYYIFISFSTEYSIRL